jgi:hypothetical protein
MESYLAIMKNEILSLASKWMEPKNIILSEVSEVQKVKGCMFCLICGKLIQYKYKKYYEKQVMLRGGHIQERKKEFR